MFDYEGFDPETKREVECEMKETTMFKAKAVQDYLDFLITIKEECDCEDAHEEIDNRIGEVLRQLLPLQYQEIAWADANVPCGKTDLF